MGQPELGATLDDIYTHGHQEAVLRSHRWRTAENSAGYLLPHLQSGVSLLDVGCGPGTITAELADRVVPGRVIGIDREASVIAEARALIGGRGNLEFGTGDIYALDFDDGAFDVVHAHQVLQHLTDPVRALGEMRRVLRPGGTLGVRDSDYAGFIWAPADPLLDRWLEIYHGVARHNQAEADAGRHLQGWVRAAGFSDVVVSTSTWTFADVQSREWWGSLWADRVLRSSFASQALEYGISDQSEMAAIADAWRRWSTQPDGFFAVPHAEILAHP